MKISSSRRNFIRGVAGASLFAIGGCRCPFGSQKIKLAVVGVMGKGFTDWLPMVCSGNAELVAICDCDRAMAAKAAEELKNRNISLDLASLPFYQDWRELLDDSGKLGIEALTVSTTDHMHAPIAITAMRKGIHVYVQKPLVRTLWELDRFGEVARETGVITQMGNQGSSGSPLRRAVEILQSGTIGAVRDVYVWTNRPVWPQGDRAYGLLRTPAEKPPASLDWNLWLGTAADRPYKGDRGADPEDYAWCAKMGHTNVYHQFNWRGFADFGTGALGDMACHLMNLPFRGLELGEATGAECFTIDEFHKGIYPSASAVKIDFAARRSRIDGRELPALRMHWYEGGLVPPSDVTAPVRDLFKAVPVGGCVVVGDRGSLLSTDSYGQNSFVIMKGDRRMRSIFKHEACRAVPETISRRAEKGTAGNYAEFIDAVRGCGPVFRETGTRCYGDIEHSVPLMEGMLIACIAQQLPGRRLEWDARRRTFGTPEADALIRPFMRSGW
jgi:predicted dehydrogenase